MIRIGLILFPGSNCERETALAVKRAGMQPVEFLWNEPLERLTNLDGYVLIGGFSYEDRSRAGIIAALDPVMQELKVQSSSGKPILGICNGAQILLEAGLVPGIANSRGQLALTENKRIKDNRVLGTGFYNSWVDIRVCDHHHPNAFTRHLNSQMVMHVPVAHAEGRFIMTDELLQQVKNSGLNLFQYCDAQGNIEDSFPINPNGSVDNIAALCNAAGNVLAMMPHPERTTEGDAIFASIRDYIASNEKLTTSVIEKITEQTKLPVFKKSQGNFECLVKLNITDNQALTVQKTLQKLGFPVLVNRYRHWEISCDTEDDLLKIKQSGLLFCERKEQDYSTHFSNHKQQAVSCLVRPTEDMISLQTQQNLAHHYDLHGVNLHHGIVWQFHSNEANINNLIADILATDIIRNNYAHECFFYE